MFFGQKPSIHLIGIGGSGMSGIAEVLLASGFPVSGSDLGTSATTERLSKMGAKCYRGHDAQNIQGATVVVVSSAVGRNNPEWLEAERQGIPVIPRAEMLAELMRLKIGVAIAGSHGKTTTTSLVGQILRPLDPTVVVGGRLQHWDASSIVGVGNHFVIEADESDRSFLKFWPVYSIVTNIDREHLDTYQDISDLEKTFLAFLNRTAFFGQNWICLDCSSLRRIRAEVVKPTQTYGFHPKADLRITRYSFEDRRSQFSLEYLGKPLADFELPVVGKHNISNATGAIGLALSLGVPIEDIQAGCRQFRQADRRLQVHCESKDWAVVEDYGHHPTEIAATLDALSVMYPDRERIVVFQPHRYSRTYALWSEFEPSFLGRCDKLYMLPIYGAHEKPIEGISSEALVDSFTRVEAKALPKVPSAEEARDLVDATPTRSRAVLVLGAAPLTTLATKLATLLSKPAMSLVSKNS